MARTRTLIPFEADTEADGKTPEMSCAVAPSGA